jgi:pimeloyl-ACP methyl ester carboxylesterase
MADRVTFKTDDNVTIVGAYYQGDPSRPAALMLHMMPAAKESWSGLAEALSAVGWSVLAIDLRGHGESTWAAGRQLDYTQFTNGEHRAKLKDVEAAMRWLGSRGADPSRTALVGASIGANLSIAYAAAHKQIPAVVALSPGLDYRGVTTADKAAVLAPSQKLFLAASAEDEYSFATDKELSRKKAGAVLREFEGLGHGTAMLERDPTLIPEIVAWLTRAVA